MTAQIGYFALLLALLISLLQAIAPFAPLQRRDPAIATFVDQAALGQLLFIVIAFASLTYAFVTSDFSLSVVAANSHTSKPLLYKVAGVWGNHEGSMLLWVLILAIFGAAVALFGDNIPDQLRSKTLGIHALIAVGFLAFIIITSNPFVTLAEPPANGNGLNPILQDPGLAVHPPFLYLGYVGFSMAFSFSVAALIEGRVDACWARWVRPWVLAAWCFLTIGIALGSAWAYYTLGWGGWWFWDPVENASLMPWLAGTALLHSALVVERRNALVSWTILLGILTFSLSLIGTFLVRSGVLTSVHAFAQDPARGEFILLLIFLSTGSALALYAIRAPKLKRGSPFSIVSRESGLVLNNVFLSAVAFTVFLGTFYPLVIDMIGGDKISVGPPYYNRTFVPIAAPLLLVMALGPALKWKRDDLRAAFRA
jgi:cytochrome c-type biogenesis protein CcmF